MTRTLKLGTRGSRLALAQSAQVAARLRALHPGLVVELVPVTTRGDRNQSVALGEVQDPDFFSAELDQALLDGTVDFCVHSLKDLPTVRHSGLACAALPVREDPRDVVIWREDVADRLARGATLRIGASSPRRQANVAAFLEEALPDLGHPPKLRFQALRGPVDQRVGRLHGPADAPDALDGVILALAGLSRLWQDEQGRAALAPRLSRARWMVLPLTRCPAAAGQGVLAVECRSGDRPVLDVLRGLHDPDTAELVTLERSALDRWPPAARPALGATAVWHDTLGPLCFVHGTDPGDGQLIEALEWSPPPRPEAPLTGFDGIAWQRLCTRKPEHRQEALQLPAGSAVFVAYWHALPEGAEHRDWRIWTSGVESWRRLAARGVWVEGCGDNLGFADTRTILTCPVLGLPTLGQWTALTYTSAVPGWWDSGVGQVLSTYTIHPPGDGAPLEKVRTAARRATHFYWSSAEQYAGLKDVVPADAHHACGAGKTLAALRAAGLDAEPFPNSHEWRRWLT